MLSQVGNGRLTPRHLCEVQARGHGYGEGGFWGRRNIGRIRGPSGGVKLVAPNLQLRNVGHEPVVLPATTLQTSILFPIFWLASEYQRETGICRCVADRHA